MGVIDLLTLTYLVNGIHITWMVENILFIEMGHG